MLDSLQSCIVLALLWCCGTHLWHQYARHSLLSENESVPKPQQQTVNKLTWLTFWAIGLIDAIEVFPKLVCENLRQCNFWLCNNATFIVYYFHVNLLTSPVVCYLKTTVSLLQYFFQFVANLLFSVYYYYYYYYLILLIWKFEIRRVLKHRPLSESAVIKSEAQWSMDDNVIGRPVSNRTFLILTDDERSRRRGMAMAILDERYEGSPDWRTLYVSVATFKSILHLFDSQCRLWSIADILDRPCWRVTTRASVFWIRSSLCRTDVEAPIIRICLV